VLARVDEREKKRGRQHRAAPFNSASEGGGSGAGIRVEEGERRRGGAGAAVGTGPWPTGAGGRRARDAEQGRRVADPWARGHSNGQRSLNNFENFKRFKNV
jgi:hypothetical protein